MAAVRQQFVLRQNEYGCPVDNMLLLLLIARLRTQFDKSRLMDIKRNFV